jgi:cytoskeletal protein CcmA (bactofilin family)
VLDIGPSSAVKPVARQDGVLKDNQEMESTGRPSVTITSLPSGVALTGDLTATEDITVDGRLEGQITVPDHHVEVGTSAIVRAKITARLVTIRGTVEGTVVASERVELTPTASVRAHLTTPSLSLHDGATFTGSVDPTRTEAAMQVAKYRQKQGNGG